MESKQNHIFSYDQEFELETGGKLPVFQLHYTTLGQLNHDRSNVVWVIHALTGNSDVTTWWPGLFEKDGPFDPSEYFVICANTLGGCYGSTGPLSVDPNTHRPYYHDFPFITNRDIIKSFDLLRQSLGLTKIDTVIGSSLGGQQALEWAIIRPEVFNKLVLIATNARHSPWGIAFNEAQRMAIEADSTWMQSDSRAGVQGMKAARAIAMLSYRSYDGYLEKQLEKSDETIDNFRAAGYQRHMGEKLALRFNAFTYWRLSKAMDSHHVGRDRESTEWALTQVKANTLVIGIESDILFTPGEQEYLAEHIPGAKLEIIHSLYGHDGFLVEFDQLRDLLLKFRKHHSTILS